MLFKELFIGENQLFGVIFKQRYPEIYAEIFGETKPDAFALVKFGNRTVLDSFTETNCKDFTGAVLDMCVDTFKSQFEVFTKKYDFLKPVLQSTSSDKTVTVSESNTDGITKSDKAFNDDVFKDDSKEDKTEAKNRNETETNIVERTGFNGNVTQAMLDEYRARLMNVREDIINALVNYLTLSIYNN
jgi:hypothetical protein